MRHYCTDITISRDISKTCSIKSSGNEERIQPKTLKIKIGSIYILTHIPHVLHGLMMNKSELPYRTRRDCWH